VGARFLLDEQISPAVAAAAGRRSIDIAAVAGSELAWMDDETIFREAIRQRRILVTYDIADFVSLYRDLLKEGADIPGIVFVDGRTITTSQVGRLASALIKLARRIQEETIDPAGGLFLSA